MQKWVTNDTIICRCEGVTYKEIKEAIEFGAQTPDDIKRLSHCGMGACQWKVCGSIISDILQDSSSFSHVRPKFRFPHMPVHLEHFSTLSNNKSTIEGDDLFDPYNAIKKEDEHL